MKSFISAPSLVTCNTCLFHEQSLPLVFPSFKLDGSIGINLCCCTQQLTRGTFWGGSSGDGVAAATSSGCNEHWCLWAVTTSICGNKQQWWASVAMGSGGNRQRRRRALAATGINSNGHHWRCRWGVVLKGRRIILKGRRRLDGSVGILPDGYQQTNPLPKIPTKQSVPTNRECLPGYFGLPIQIPTLHSLIGPAIGKARIPWLSCH